MGWSGSFREGEGEEERSRGQREAQWSFDLLLHVEVNGKEQGLSSECLHILNTHTHTLTVCVCVLPLQSDSESFSANSSAVRERRSSLPLGL